MNMNKLVFPDKLIVTPNAITGDWEVIRDFRYMSQDAVLITVESGFITDFASIPKVGRIIYESWGSYGYAAVIHDWLYTTRDGTRRQADRVFYEAMIDSGVPYLRAMVLWFAVRIGGWWTWRTRRV